MYRPLLPENDSENDQDQRLRFFQVDYGANMQESILPSLQVHEFPQAGHSIHNTDRVLLSDAMGWKETMEEVHDGNEGWDNTIEL